jgi:hypothetical protein
MDLTVLQPISWLAASISVCLGVLYYIMNLRETNRSRKIAFTTTMIQTLLSDEGAKRYGELMNMKWNSFPEFKEKYDGTINVEMFSKRWAFWSECEALGYLKRIGLVDAELLYNLCRRQVLNGWVKFEPIISEYKREGNYSMDSFRDFEQLAHELCRLQHERDPSFRGSSGYVTAGEYERVFSKSMKTGNKQS